MLQRDKSSEQSAAFQTIDEHSKHRQMRCAATSIVEVNRTCTRTRFGHYPRRKRKAEI
jgi:hypothetical protein